MTAPESIGAVVRRVLLMNVAGAVAIGLLAAIVAWATGHGVSSTIAVTYYIVGCILFLIGMFPSGGFSLVRGTKTKRRPIGSEPHAIFLLGLVLIALGVVADVMHPF